MALRRADPYGLEADFVAFSVVEVDTVSFALLSTPAWRLFMTLFVSVGGVEPSEDGDESHCRDKWNRREGTGNRR